MKKDISPLAYLGLAIVFYVGAVLTGYDTFVGSALALVGLVLLILAVVKGIKKLAKR